MIQFFAPDIESTGILPQEDSLHCVRVLRHREGDTITVTDGRGHRFSCRIVSADPRATAVDVESTEDVPTHWGCRITLAVAPTKNLDRMEWMVEKAIEIGVDKIVPVICDHSERRVLKPERLRKIAVSAMKQSLKATLPEVTDLMPLRDFLRQSHPGQKFMGYCDKTYPLLTLAREYTGGTDVTILIGPEGDFSSEEIKEAVDAGFIPVTFGESRLRTETAAIVALDTVHVLTQLTLPAAE
ncbi:MAG: 16S rRNA (uracil(1498)-N(3))-methyltransferase [Muribaculaceae bacterium]|nr:16S rRNA (uracil(1498)-N(3))-methyltransferase [Muribaculaceae bacterium]